MPVRHVTVQDCGRLEGTDINPLYDAVKAVCHGIEGDGLWEEILAKHGLGVRGPGDCPNWVKRMNRAIDVWNAADPKICADIQKAYEL